jgi:hypothetical protein
VAGVLSVPDDTVHRSDDPELQEGCSWSSHCPNAIQVERNGIREDSTNARWQVVFVHQSQHCRSTVSAVPPVAEGDVACTEQRVGPLLQEEEECGVSVFETFASRIPFASRWKPSSAGTSKKKRNHGWPSKDLRQ